ncbi:MAG: alpha/beta hydrolase family protein [Planctomycetota bacterium]|jgi:dipeptidyl aminopeptidase/acylaminoacyl peptidase
MRIRFRSWPGVLPALLLAHGLAWAEDYRLPPPEVVEIVDAPPVPTVRLSPDRQWMLLIEGTSLPSIEDVSRRMLRLAGTRIDPASNGRFTTRFDRGLALRRVDGNRTRALPVPGGGRLASVSWSHDSRHIAWTVVTDRGTELWGASVEPDVKPRRLLTDLNTVTLGLEWMPGGSTVLCGIVPPGRGAEPEAPSVPRGPNTQETTGERSPLRTYQDLLSSPHDEALFEHYATSQPVLVSIAEGGVTRLGPPAVYREISPSPDGRHLLVSRLEKPFSYQMPWWSFPHTYEIWSADGRPEHVAARIPMGENIPIGGVRTGPRMIRWKPGAPATLVWAEALDGGDPKREVAHRDRWLEHEIPFDGEPRELLRIEQRARRMTFLRDPALVITDEYDRDRRWTRSLLHDLRDPLAMKVLDDRSIRDRYGDPGRITTVPTASGHRVALQQGPWIFRTGSGPSPDGVHPFLDRQNVETLETERLWRCGNGAYESVAAVWIEDDRPQFITRHETPVSPPNYRRRGLGDEEARAVTDFPDPTPQIRGIRKEVVTYERHDGVQLSATLYLPADYRPGTRLPLLLWAYPIEFNDPGTASQVTKSPHRFTRIRGASHLHLLTQGYAIMDGATMPIIGHPETMNDTFIEQIVASARAAIDKAVELGVADGRRVGVGGHSYGAFMTANLLAHCDLLRAGVARSGAYNRTLTPFGFQGERRPLWGASEVYFAISPFLHADAINEPLLLIHGELDSNSGTYPMQSQRLFKAIKGNGGITRLVMLPGESHGYRARESVLHTLAEMIDWFDRYVKYAEPSPRGAVRTRPAPR